MRRQLQYLIEISERPQINIRVVPLSAGPHPGLDGSFIIMELPDEPAVVYQESKTRNAFMEAEDVEIYRVAWKWISTVALSAGETRDRLASAIANYA